MKKRILITSLCALFFAQSCNTSPEGKVGDMSIESAEGDKVLLRLKPKVGDKQKGLMTMEINSAGEEGMEMRMNYDLQIADFKDNFYTYSVKYNSIKMDVKTGRGISFSYDSTQPEQSGMSFLHESMQELLKEPLTMKMDEMGHISELTLPGIETNQQADLGSMVIPLPTEAVGVNDSWTSEKKVEGMGILKMTMTLKKILVDDIIIGTEGKIVNEGKETGNFTGEYTLRRDNGLTKDGTMNLNTKVEGKAVKMKVNYKSL